MSSLKPGDAVIRLHDPSRVGRVVRVEEDDQLGEVLVTVQFEHRQETWLEGELAPATEQRDPWRDAEAGALGSASRLGTLLTWERIRRPPGLVGSAFGSARATLYPYQIKPLVRFLENPNHRLLIADEVGLGKTIEAGYIVREWIERTHASRILVVVPARLRTKWREELSRRFGMVFQVVGAPDLAVANARLRSGQELEPFQWIASYEQLRGADLVATLTELRPPLDLVILDEAHRARNRETLQHRLARALAGAAQAMVFLSATPVQTGLEDLHALLDLLDEGAFGRADDFHRLVAANRPILEAAQEAAAGDFAAAARTLGRLAHDPLTRGLAEDAEVHTIRQRLAEAPAPSRAARVELQAAIGELSLTGHLITRTRKAEVLEDRPIRAPQVVRVELGPEERAVYDAVKDATRLLCQAAGSWGQQMAALTALRYTASCIPAAQAWLRERLQRDGAWLDPQALAGEVEEDLLLDEGPRESGSALWNAALRARVSRALSQPLPRDSKLLQLEEALKGIWDEDASTGRARRKVIVFSFFKRTLAWLGQALRRQVIAHETIHGDVPIAEREAAITRFLNDPRVDVLLSSEVGGEGLDLQAASVVINYDLPWNPMVVEQRIGRVDRLGQTAPRLAVLSLVARETVEDRILARLYERIHLFESALGESEEILGSREVQRLVLESLRGDLSDEELGRRVEQTAQAAIQRQQAVAALSGQVDGLLAADQAVLDQLQLLVEGHRLPRPEDIPRLLTGFLAENFPGSRLEGDPVRGVGTLQLSDSALQRFAAWSERHAGLGRALVQQLRQGAAEVTANGELALRRPRAWLLQARHPLVQMAVDTVADHLATGGSAYAVRVRAPDAPAGPWLVGIWSLAAAGTHDAELLAAAHPVGGGQARVGAEAEPLLRALLDAPEELDPRPALEPAAVRQAADAVQRAFGRALILHRRQAEETQRRRRLRRRATLEATLRQQLERAEAHLARMREGGQPFAVRMAEVQVGRCARALASVEREETSAGVVAGSNHLVAVVLVVNEPAESTDGVL